MRKQATGVSAVFHAQVIFLNRKAVGCSITELRATIKKLNYDFDPNYLKRQKAMSNMPIKGWVYLPKIRNFHI